MFVFANLHHVQKNELILTHFLLIFVSYCPLSEQSLYLLQKSIRLSILQNEALKKQQTCNIFENTVQLPTTS